MPNLPLASDYVLTQNDLTTIEGAYEAGRPTICVILRQDKLPNSPMVQLAEFSSSKRG
jgi:hypothetical protein